MKLYYIGTKYTVCVPNVVEVEVMKSPEDVPCKGSLKQKKSCELGKKSRWNFIEIKLKIFNKLNIKYD